jgi:hypothetical protein
MKITRRMLLDAGACSPGVEWFDQKYSTGEADVEALADALAAECLPDFFRFILERVNLGEGAPRAEKTHNGGCFFAPYGATFSGGVDATGAVISGGDFTCNGDFSAPSLDVYGATNLASTVRSSQWVRASGEITYGGELFVNCWEPRAILRKAAP